MEKSTRFSIECEDIESGHRAEFVGHFLRDTTDSNSDTNVDYIPWTVNLDLHKLQV
jgi:hypothetical protein